MGPVRVVSLAPRLAPKGPNGYLLPFLVFFEFESKTSAYAMSVYTHVSMDELHSFLEPFWVGTPQEFVGICQGVENTNYFLTTDEGAYVLTIFERVNQRDLPFFLNLMAFLADHGLPTPRPISKGNGDYIEELAGKPAALVTRLPGRIHYSPEVVHCAEVGQTLGRMHRVGRHFHRYRPNSHGFVWWYRTATALEPSLKPDEKQLVQDELAYQRSHQQVAVPRGVIHADLFHDNALFEDDILTGIFDFYYACNDVLLYDLAIVVNDWCSQQDASLDPQRTAAVLHRYHSKRPLTQLEESLWPTFLRAAALRFWVSRLWDYHHPRGGQLISTKDPDRFRAILECRRSSSQDHWVGWPAL